MKYWKRMASSLLWIAVLPLFSQTGGSSSSASGEAKESKIRPEKVADQSAGEVKFAQNCSRCHKAPESFSPNISGTIVRHMRVRASLSEQDEKDILRFLNP